MGAAPARTRGRTGVGVTALGNCAMELRGAPPGPEIAPEQAERVLAAAAVLEPARDLDELRRELAEIRRRGHAVSHGELDEGASGVAAPILDHRRRFLGTVGISMSRHAFDTERAALEETLRDVVRFQPSADVREVLDRGPEPRLASALVTVGGAAAPPHPPAVVPRAGAGGQEVRMRTGSAAARSCQATMSRSSTRRLVK